MNSNTLYGNVLFIDALDIFCLRLYGVGHNYGKRTTHLGESRYRHCMGYYFRIAEKNVLYVPTRR